MFYTEYRPQKFNDLLNAKHIVSSITGSLANGNPAHAYFFTGSRGIGKTSAARLLAKAINCEAPLVKDKLKDVDSSVQFEPCGKCSNCTAIQEGRHLDMIEIDAASNRGIDNIRELRDNVKLSPSMGKNKIYIIDEVHMLTTEASNALLKTLEEPPEHAYFILCTTNPEKVLPTVKSRCQQFQFLRPGIDDLVGKLRFIANDKKYEISDEKLRRIAIIAKGAFREAETLLEQLINGDVSVEELLNEQESNYYEFMALLLSGNQADSVRFVHEVYGRGVSMELWTEKLVEYCRSLIFAKLKITGVDNTFELNDLEQKLVTDTSLDTLKNATQRFAASLLEFKFAVVLTLPLEIAIIDVAGFAGSGETVISSKPTPQGPAKKVVESSVTHQSPPSKVEIAKQVSPKKNLEFPYLQLIEKVKPKNHSIHLTLRSCKMIGFDGEKLNLEAAYSFHKERVMSHKVRAIIEDAASALVGRRVIVECGLSDKKPDAKRLTDRNVRPADSDKSEKDEMAGVFKDVFGDDLESAS